MHNGLMLAAALFNLGFAAFHLLFWRILHWPASLRDGGELNAAVTQTLNIVLTYVFLVYGVALLWQAWHEAQPHRLLPLAGAGFWLLRACLQPLLFRMDNRYSRILLAIFVAGALLHLAAGMRILGVQH